MLTGTQINRIIENWGKEVYEKILDEIKICSEKWRLSNFSFFESYSMNAVFFCRSETRGDCALKIGGKFQDDEFVWEYNVLREYRGRRFVRVFEGDIDIKNGRKVMLIERLVPGKMLQDEKNLDARLAVFSELFNGMHIEPENAGLYKKYADGVDDCAEKISKRGDCKDLAFHMAKARDIYRSVSAVYSKEMLLHGDLHYHNILLGRDGGYTVIDPQGRVGDRVFDIPRYILIEYYNTPASDRAARINHIFEYFENSLKVPGEILRRCFYIETASFECWCASVGDYDINNVLFAEGMMNQGSVP
jgi:thiamine kinase-like enzyme